MFCKVLISLLFCVALPTHAAGLNNLFKDFKQTPKPVQAPQTPTPPATPKLPSLPTSQPKK
jgi:hypothetical protein